MSEIVIPEEQKGYQCEVLLDSMNPVGIRLVTMRWKYPLMVHAEACRHRCFSRSVASNRAIPTRRILAMIEQDPVIPVWWGKAQPGMQAEAELTAIEQQKAVHHWHLARLQSMAQAMRLTELGLHKQIVNRLLAPFQWVTEIVSATDWANFFALRCHPAAQPEMRRIAEMAQAAYDASRPESVTVGEWHLPLLGPEDRELPPERQRQVSAARCARTSYRTHEGRISTLEEDLSLYDRLVGSDPRHASPTEHQAQALGTTGYCRNFRGWRQHRELIPNDTVLDLIPEGSR